MHEGSTSSGIEGVADRYGALGTFHSRWSATVPACQGMLQSVQYLTLPASDETKLTGAAFYIARPPLHNTSIAEPRTRSC